MPGYTVLERDVNCREAFGQYESSLAHYLEAGDHRRLFDHITDRCSWAGEHLVGERLVWATREVWEPELRLRLISLAAEFGASPITGP